MSRRVCHVLALYKPALTGNAKHRRISAAIPGKALGVREREWRVGAGGGRSLGVGRWMVLPLGGFSSFHVITMWFTAFPQMSLCKPRLVCGSLRSASRPVSGF